jgi:hypothetical protein
MSEIERWSESALDKLNRDLIAANRRAESFRMSSESARNYLAEIDRLRWFLFSIANNKMPADKAEEHAKAALSGTVQHRCDWTNDGPIHDTACGHLWQFSDGTNISDITFCPYCGGKIASTANEFGG